MLSFYFDLLPSCLDFVIQFFQEYSIFRFGKMSASAHALDPFLSGYLFTTSLRIIIERCDPPRTEGRSCS
jgi:hypothetical protein